MRLCPVAAALAIAVVSGLAHPSLAGPLNPPPGPVASTGKAQVNTLPATISAPGSYIINADLSAAAGAITIAASNVVLDLNGYTVGGGAITAAVGTGRIVIRNGTVQAAAGGARIDLSSASWCRLENVLVSGASTANDCIITGVQCEVVGCSTLGGGINVGAGSRVVDCIARDATGNCFTAGNNCVITGCIAGRVNSTVAKGFVTGNNCQVSSCTASDCTVNGFEVGQSCVLSGCGAVTCGTGFKAGFDNAFTVCAARANSTSGFDAGLTCRFDGCLSNFNGPAGGTTGFGFKLTDDSSLAHCTASGNQGQGVSAGVRLTVVGCAVNANRKEGIAVIGDFARIEGTSVDSNGSGATSAGISVGFHASVTGCSASGNSGNGIVASGDCEIRRCIANQNGADGIGIPAANAGSVIADCSCSHNKDDGIQVGYNCLLSGNSCVRNGALYNAGGTATGAGIHVTALSCRLEGNTVVENNRGLWLEVAGNTLIRNTARGNTDNFGSVTAGNDFPLAASATAATNPFANFAF